MLHFSVAIAFSLLLHLHVPVCANAPKNVAIAREIVIERPKALMRVAMEGHGNIILCEIFMFECGSVVGVVGRPAPLHFSTMQTQQCHGVVMP